LGGIDVYLLNTENGKWEFQTTFNETGPIAINKQFIPLQYKNISSDIKIKLVLIRETSRAN
jgi:hypothetical protein